MRETNLFTQSLFPHLYNWQLWTCFVNTTVISMRSRSWGIVSLKIFEIILKYSHKIFASKPKWYVMLRNYFLWINYGIGVWCQSDSLNEKISQNMKVNWLWQQCSIPGFWNDLMRNYGPRLTFIQRILFYLQMLLISSQKLGFSSLKVKIFSRLLKADYIAKSSTKKL